MTPASSSGDPEHPHTSFAESDDDDDEEEDDEEEEEDSSDDEDEDDDDEDDDDDDDLSDVSDLFDLDHYDEENLPEYSCRYCGIHEPACVAQCVETKKWFCNRSVIPTSATVAVRNQ